MKSKLLAVCCAVSLAVPGLAFADWTNPTSRSLCDDPKYVGTDIYNKYCGGSQYIYNPPPDPKILALQQANARYSALIQKWRDDFGFSSVQEWLNLDRSSEEAFLNTAGQLDRVFVDQINKFYDDLNEDRIKVGWLEAFPSRAAALQSNIAVVDRDIQRYEKPLADARQELDRLTTAVRGLQGLQETYKLRMQRNRWLAVEAWSVYLPGKFVRIDADKAVNINRLASIRLEGDILPFTDAGTPNLEVVPPWLLGKFDNRYLLSPAAGVNSHEPYRQLRGTPEEVAAFLEADEQKVVKAFKTRNGYDMAHGERLDYEERINQLNRMEQQQTEKMHRLEDILEQRKQVFPELNATRKNARSEAARLIDRASESLVWEITKNTAVETCKKLVKKVYHGRVAALDLTDEEIFEHYSNKRYNIFNLPATIFQVRDIKAVQNDIITLLKHDQGYAKTAVRLAAHGDPAEIREFVGDMFTKLDKDGNALIDDALSATSAMPEPLRTLAAKYFKRQVREASDAE